MMNTPTDDDWNDLSALFSSSFINNHGMLVIDYDWDKEQDESKTKEVITHLLRKALRKVGHKITTMRSGFDEHRRVWTVYETTITREEGEKMANLWNDWIEEVEDLQYLEDDSEDETESVNVDAMEDDNPSN